LKTRQKPKPAGQAGHEKGIEMSKRIRKLPQPADRTIEAALDEVTVPVSRDISNACRVGWSVSGAVGKTSKGWRILEAWNVHP